MIFAANWKLNKNPEQTRQFFKDFALQLPQNLQSDCIFFPPATNLEAASQSLKDTKIQFGSQNCYLQSSGAFTGEISAQVVKDLGGKYILVGHSERRTYFGENDAFIADKVKYVQSLDLIPVVCIGETLDERLNGKTNEVLYKQLEAITQTVEANKKWIIAYEPVWAIGTGVVAKNEQVQETHAFIREYLIGKSFSQDLPILYGGSVKGVNAAELADIANVNGFLVGGASLEVKSFLEICTAVK